MSESTCHVTEDHKVEGCLSGARRRRYLQAINRERYRAAIEEAKMLFVWTGELRERIEQDEARGMVKKCFLPTRSQPGYDDFPVRMEPGEIIPGVVVHEDRYESGRTAHGSGI